MRLLLAEDDPLLGEGLQMALSAEGYTVDWLRDGCQASQAASSEDYAIMVLDLGLPCRDGMEVLRLIRDRRITMPVLILTARDAIPDRISGLNHGADDYLTKPFDIDELAARLRALLRRSQGRASPCIEHAGLRLDPAAHRVSLHGQDIKLSNREFAVLHYLLQHQGQVISRQQLESALYGWQREVESNAVEVHIHKLRKKLGKDFIETARGIGYRLP